MPVKARSFIVAAAAFLVAAPVSAQVELTPFYGFTIPQGNLCCSDTPGVLESQELEPAPAIGLSLGFRRGSVAFEGSLSFSPTLQRDEIGLGIDRDTRGLCTPQTVSCAELPVTNSDQSLVFFTGSILWYPGDNPIFEPYLAIGAGGRSLGDADVFQGWEDNTVDFTIGIGGGLRFHYNDRLSIRVDARDWISSFDWNELDPDNDTEQQNDIVLTTGFSIILGSNQ